MHAVMILPSLEKCAGGSALFLVQFRKIFCEIAEFAGDNGPAIGGQPLRNRVQVSAFRDETGPGSALGNIVVLAGRGRLDMLPASLDRRRLDVRARIGMMRFDQ